MSAADWAPSDAERRKFAGYSVDVREGGTVFCRVLDGKVYRLFWAVRRIPSQRQFVVFIRSGATEDEKALARDWGSLLPAGEWARHAEEFTRVRRKDGTYHWHQARGIAVDDSLIDLELAMMLDLENVLEGGVSRA